MLVVAGYNDLVLATPYVCLHPTRHFIRTQGLLDVVGRPKLHGLKVDRPVSGIIAVPFSDWSLVSKNDALGAHLFPNCSLAAATTCSGLNPNFLCSSLSGAEAPNVFMPIMRPSSPVYRSQPKVDACSTATRAFPPGGSTLSL